LLALIVAALSLLFLCFLGGRCSGRYSSSSLRCWPFTLTSGWIAPYLVWNYGPAWCSRLTRPLLLFLPPYSLRCGPSLATGSRLRPQNSVSVPLLSVLPLSYSFHWLVAVPARCL